MTVGALSQAAALCAEFVTPISHISVAACSGDHAEQVTPAHFEGIGLAVIIADSADDETLGLLSIAGNAARASGAVALALLLQPPEFAVQAVAAEISGCVDALVMLPPDAPASVLHRTINAYIEASASRLEFLLPAGADLLDLRSAFKGAQHAFLSVGMARGEHRATRAAERAVLKVDRLAEASGLLLVVAGDRTLRLREIVDAATTIRNAFPTLCEHVLTVHFDTQMRDQVRVTILATVARAG